MLETMIPDTILLLVLWFHNFFLILPHLYTSSPIFFLSPLVLLWVSPFDSNSSFFLAQFWIAVYGKSYLISLNTILNSLFILFHLVSTIFLLLDGLILALIDALPDHFRFQKAHLSYFLCFVLVSWAVEEGGAISVFPDAKDGVLAFF